MQQLSLRFIEYRHYWHYRPYISPPSRSDFSHCRSLCVRFFCYEFGYFAFKFSLKLAKLRAYTPYKKCALFIHFLCDLKSKVNRLGFYLLGHLDNTPIARKSFFLFSFSFLFVSRFFINSTICIGMLKSTMCGRKKKESIQQSSKTKSEIMLARIKASFHNFNCSRAVNANSAGERMCVIHYHYFECHKNVKEKSSNRSFLDRPQSAAIPYPTLETKSFVWCRHTNNLSIDFRQQQQQQHKQIRNYWWNNTEIHLLNENGHA